MNFTVRSSPTYLEDQPFTRGAVLAVRFEEASIDSPPENPNDASHNALATRVETLLPNPGMPLIPWPSYWYVSANNWQVDVKGEYARFEVSSTSGGPDGPSTTYVRQAQPVNLDIGGEERHVGNVTNVNFSSTTNIVVVAPGFTVSPTGDWGAGDRIAAKSDGKPTENGLSKCSPTWDQVGPNPEDGEVKEEECANLGKHPRTTSATTTRR